ncbi:MAG: hypothetical protein ACE5H3_09855 [Planctomycetota bacterium]
MSPAVGFDLPRLRGVLEPLPGAMVAFSGGVDSSVLLCACLEILGRSRVAAVLANSPSLARREYREAREVAAGLRAELIELRTREAEDPRYLENRGDRCYWCKESLFTGAGPLARARGWALLYGENADDVARDRPGSRSARERGVLAPLREAGWTKEMVRAFARARSLPVADKPSMPCLASRIPVGQRVTGEALARVELLEDALRRRGYRVVRARHLSPQKVRLEFGGQDLARAREEAHLLARLARQAGFGQMEIDPRGYRQGRPPLLRRWNSTSQRR